MSIREAFVNLGSTPGGDGTTNGTSGATRAWASLSLAEAGEQGDLVTDTEIIKIICDNDGGTDDTTVVVFSGSTTSTTFFFWITAAENSKHDGTPGTGYKIEVNAAFDDVVTISSTATIFEWIEVVNLSTANASAFRLISTNNSILVNCIATTADSGLDRAAFKFETSGGATAINCLAYSSPGGGFTMGRFGAHSMYNCVARDCGKGFIKDSATGDDPKLINCLGFNNTTVDFETPDDWHVSTDTNGSEDLTAPGTTNFQSLTAADDVDVTNYFPKGTGSDLFDSGTDLSSVFDALDRSTDYIVRDEDIIGTARPQGAEWDIGIGELVAAAGGEGAGVQTLPALTQQGVVVMLPEGIGVQDLPSFIQQGTAVMLPEAVGAQDLPSLAQQGTGDMDFEGAGVQDLPSLTQQGTAVQLPEGVGGQALPPLTQQGTGLQAEPTGAGAQDLPSLTQQGTAVQLPEATGAQALPSLTQQSTGDQGQPGAGVQDLPSLTQQGTVAMLPEGIGGQALPSLTQQATAIHGEPEGTGAQDLPALTQQGTAVMLPEATGAQDLPSLTQQGTGDMDFEGVGGQTLPALIQLGSGTLVGAVIGGVFRPIFRPRRRPGQGRGK